MVLNEKYNEAIELYMRAVEKLESVFVKKDN